MTKISLTPSPKKYSKDLDKTIAPEETVHNVLKILDDLPITILAETKRIDINRLGIPVYLSVCGSDARKIMPTRKQMGKGASRAQAQASALMELVERFSFFSFWNRLPDAVSATWNEAEALFGKEKMLSLTAVATACHDSRDDESVRQIMNLRKWLFFPATCIATRKITYVPLDLFKQLEEFNGSSAGNTDAESILQGCCELIERHVCAILDRTQSTLPTIDATKSSDPVLLDLLNKFRNQGIFLILKDCSTDMPVPTVVALAMDPTTFPERSEIVLTAGTACTPEKAAIRAITEVAQLAGDFCTSACYEASGLPKYDSWEETEWLREGPVVLLSDLPSIEHDDILTELDSLSQKLAEKEHILYSISTTHPQVNIPAHYSFIPGFQFRERDINASLGLFVGRLLTEQEDAATATAGLNVLEGIYPNAHFIPFFHGMLALRNENIAQAQQYFCEAIPIQPEKESRALASFYYGYTLTLQEHWEEALPSLKKAVSLCPDMKEYRNLLGVSFYKCKNYVSAAEQFAFIINKLDKGSALDLQNLGMCHKHIGNSQEAINYLKAALELDPSLSAAATNLCMLEKDSDPQ